MYWTFWYSVVWGLYVLNILVFCSIVSTCTGHFGVSAVWELWVLDILVLCSIVSTSTGHFGIAQFGDWITGHFDVVQFEDYMYWTFWCCAVWGLHVLDILMLCSLRTTCTGHFGVVQFGDYMYWTDWQTEKIEQASKYDGSGRTLIQSRLEGLMDIHLVSPLRQTGR